MPAARAMPFGQCSGPVHAFDDLTPADAGVVGAERDFAFLRSIWDDAHFRAPEVVGPEILKPHTLDAKNTPVISLGTRLHPIVAIAIGALRSGSEQIHDLRDREAFRRPVRLEVSKDGQGKLSRSQSLSSRRIRDDCNIANELFIIEELEQRAPLFRFAVNHNEREDAAVRMAITCAPAPGRVRTLEHVHDARERAVRGQGKPIAHGLQIGVQLRFQVCHHFR